MEKQQYLTLEEARSILTELGYERDGDGFGEFREAWEAGIIIVDIGEAVNGLGDPIGISIRYNDGIGGNHTPFRCKTEQQFRWALKVCELEADIYYGDWSMCHDVFGDMDPVT